MISLIEKDSLRIKNPSMFIKHPREGVSDKYSFVDTEDIMDTFLENGFHISRASSVKARKLENRDHCKHIVAFRRNDENWITDPSGNKPMFPEIIMTNSSDAKNSISLLLCIYTLVCSNGLIRGTSYETLRMRHTNIQMDLLNSYIQHFQGNIDNLSKQVSSFASRILDDKTRIDFATKAAAIRWNSDIKLNPESLLMTRRDEDRGNDLWSTYNVVQENIIRGGVSTFGRSRDRFTRPVRSTVKDFDINTKLWNLAESYVLN